MSALDLQARAEELLSAAVTVDDDGDVTAVALPLASQAIELVLAIGGDIAGLLQTQRWSYDPQLILSLVVDGEALDRECRIHAVWCARQTLSGMPTTDRRVALGVLIVALRHARGRATDADLTAARNAAGNAARDAAGTAARRAARAAAGYAARNAAWDAAWDAARRAARDAARAAAGTAAWNAAGNAARDAAWDAARIAAGNAGWDAAWDAAWDTQQTRLVNRTTELHRRSTTT